MTGPEPSAPTRAGFLVLMLHAHLPYVRHPDEPHFLEEDWLYEAITETYLPLLEIADGWARDRVPATVTLSLSPPLLEMLHDDLLMDRYRRRLQRLISFADDEVNRNSWSPHLAQLSAMYRQRLTDAATRFDALGGDLVRGFVDLARRGTVELVTSAATHAFLPAFELPLARVQLALGLSTFERHTGLRPRGVWLPECGFTDAIGAVLGDLGVEWFVVDAHAVELADPPAVFGTYSPVLCPAGTAAFPRDPAAAAQVWSSEFGYPGDGRYREFYRDVGHDLADASLLPFDLPGGARRNVGLKYHRVTGRDVDLGAKELYDPPAAAHAVVEHARHYVEGRAAQLREAGTQLGRPAVLTVPFDAELFGHWWFEGPAFLDAVVRGAPAAGIELTSPAHVLDTGGPFQVTTPAASSWGAFGYADTWVNDRNAWVWPLLLPLVDAFRDAVRAADPRDPLATRAVVQAGRELLLAASSDWPFLITMSTAEQYASQRITGHVQSARALLESAVGGNVDTALLERLEAAHPVFPDLDLSCFTALVAP